MLNTLPPSPTCPHPPSSVSRPVRRRGGQPSNHNALRYGCFARHNPTPLTLLVNSIRVSTAGLESLPAVLRQAILDLRLQIARLLAVRPDGGDLRATLAWHRPIVRLIGLILRLHKALARYETPQHHLQFVAQHALALIRYEFRESGITRDAYSFRAKTELSDLNSSALQEDGITHAVDSFRAKTELSDLNSPVFRKNDITQAAHSFREKNKLSDLNSPPFPEEASPSGSGSPLPFLTPRQWELVESLLPSPSGEGLGEKSRRGHPPSDPRPLLDAIFWKIAHHARWQDLPHGAPPMLTCRRYYRRLFLSGRLFTIYTSLHADLQNYVKVDLAHPVDQGCFTLSGNTLYLSPHLDETWQLRTALLFMQQAYQVSRHILRKKDQEQRRRFPHFH